MQRRKHLTASGALEVVGTALLKGDLKSGDRIALATLAEDLSIERDALDQVLPQLIGEQLVAREGSAEIWVTAPRSLGGAKPDQFDVTRLLRHWIPMRLWDPAEPLGYVSLKRLIVATSYALECGLAMLGGAGDLHYTHSGFVVPGAQSARDRTIEQLRGLVALRPSGTLLEAAPLARQLGVTRYGVREGLAHLWGEGVVQFLDRACYVAPLPDSRESELRGTKRYATVQAVAAWLDAAALEPGTTVPAYVLAEQLKTPKQRCLEALSFHTGAGRLAYVGAAYVVRGSHARESMMVIPAPVEKLAAYLATLPAGTPVPITELEQRLSHDHRMVSPAVAWLIGAGVLTSSRPARTTGIGLRRSIRSPASSDGRQANVSGDE